MSKVTEKIKEELLIRCAKSKEKDGYDFWNEHIKYVVENAVELAKKYHADVIAHFDCIPSLFSLAYKEENLSIAEGAEFVKKKLERDFGKLSEKSKELLKDRYENILKVLFVK